MRTKKIKAILLISLLALINCNLFAGNSTSINRVDIPTFTIEQVDIDNYSALGILIKTYEIDGYRSINPVRIKFSDNTDAILQNIDTTISTTCSLYSKVVYPYHYYRPDWANLSNSYNKTLLQSNYFSNIEVSLYYILDNPENLIPGEVYSLSTNRSSRVTLEASHANDNISYLNYSNIYSGSLANNYVDEDSSLSVRIDSILYDYNDFFNGYKNEYFRIKLNANGMQNSSYKVALNIQSKNNFKVKLDNDDINTNISLSSVPYTLSLEDKEVSNNDTFLIKNIPGSSSSKYLSLYTYCDTNNKILNAGEYTDTLTLNFITVDDGSIPAENTISF